MEKLQIKKLKINATKIKNSLFKGNKELIRLKKDRIKLFTTEEQKKKISKKEFSLESSPIKAISNIGKNLLSYPLSLIDKFKEFFGIILLGVLVNNLPTIVQNLQNIFEKIKTFLDQNPWIVNAIKFGFKMFGEGIMALAKFIKFVKPYVGGSFKFALDTIRATKNEIGTLIQTFDELDLAFGGLIRDLGVDKAPEPSSKDYSSFISGGGKAAVESGKTVEEVIEQGRKNISKYDSGSRAPINKLPQQGYTSYQPKPPEKFAKGGTIGNIPPKEGTRRGGPSDVTKNTLSQSSKIRSPFARPGGTAIGRRSVKAVNSFKTFKMNVDEQSIDIEKQQKNYNLFDELLKKFKELQKLKEKEKTENGGGGDGGPGGGAYGGNVIVTSDSSDFWLLATAALFENSSPQGAADVAQVIYNRVAAPGDPWRTRGSIRTAILNPGQFQPVRQYGGTSVWSKIVDKKSALEFVTSHGKSKKQLETVSSALLDSSRQSSARTFVGPRDGFRMISYEQTANELADDTEVKRFGHVFGFEPRGAQIEKFRQGKLQPATVNKETRGTVTPVIPPIVKGKVLSKGETVVVEGNFRLRPDAAAAYLAMKADAKKEGVNITLTSAWRSSGVQAYLYDLFLRGLGNLAAPPGRSNHEKGLAIDIKTGIPWAQKNGMRYGWANTGMTFSQKEPWHFDYVGGYAPPQKPISQIKKNNNIISATNMTRAELMSAVKSLKIGQKIIFPGIGSIQGGKDFFGKMEVKFYDPKGKQLDIKSFSRLLNIDSQQSIEPVKPQPISRQSLPNRMQNTEQTLKDNGYISSLPRSSTFLDQLSTELNKEKETTIMYQPIIYQS